MQRAGSNKYEMRKQALEKEFVEKKTLLEKDFAEREAIIVAKEKELLNLALQVEEFPARLQQAISNIEKTVTERLRFTHDYEAKLLQKEVKEERKLHQQMNCGVGVRLKV